MLLGLYFLYPLSIQKEKVCFLLLLPTSLPPSLPPSVLPFLSPSSLKEMVWKDSLCWFFFFLAIPCKKFLSLKDAGFEADLFLVTLPPEFIFFPLLRFPKDSLYEVAAEEF